MSEDRAKFNCASLIGGSLDPYDLTLVRRADVASRRTSRGITAEHVAPGDDLVYVEAGGFKGEAEFAGCCRGQRADHGGRRSVELTQAKMFDCREPRHRGWLALRRRSPVHGRGDLRQRHVW